MCTVECHIKVPDIPAHPGSLLCLHVADGGEGGPPGGVQGQAGHNLPDILLLLDASPGSLKSMQFRLIEFYPLILRNHTHSNSNVKFKNKGGQRQQKVEENELILKGNLRVKTKCADHLIDNKSKIALCPPEIYSDWLIR